MATKYVYMAGGREVSYEDATDAYKPDDIRQHWAQSFPELANATWEEKKEGETRVITFAKKVGTKG